MPQCNFSNKILLPKLPGLHAAPCRGGALCVLSAAGRDFKGEARSSEPPAEGARDPFYTACRRASTSTPRSRIPTSSRIPFKKGRWGGGQLRVSRLIS